MLKFKITRPPLRQHIENIEIMSPGVEMEVEFGSAKESLAWFTESDAALVPMFGGSIILKIDLDTPAAIEEQGDVAVIAPPVTETEKPARKPRAPKVEAIAPAPLPVPAAEAVPVPEAAGDGIPEALRRAPPAPLPPAPPAPPSPPAPPAPPTGVLAAKIVAVIEDKVKDAADGGTAYVTWLAHYGVVQAGVPYGEAIAAVALATDAQLAQVATALGVS